MTILLSATAIAAVPAMPAATSVDVQTTDAPRIERSLDEEIVVTGKHESPFRGESRAGRRLPQPVDHGHAGEHRGGDALAPRFAGCAGSGRSAPQHALTQQATSPTTSNNFVSRGVLMNARTNYRLNGALQIINLGPIPIENKQRVELLKGVSALYYGISTPSGIADDKGLVQELRLTGAKLWKLRYRFGGVELKLALGD
jgi:iron complex outermembrane receptor protein